MSILQTGKKRNIIAEEIPTLLVLSPYYSPKQFSRNSLDKLLDSFLSEK